MLDEYNVDDVVLINDREYAVVKKIGNVYLLVTMENPIDILVGRIINKEFIVETDHDMIMNILLK